MRDQRRTKVIATLGPASDAPEQIERLAEAGVDMFRLNFSHGTHDDHRRRADAVRCAEAHVGGRLGLLQDLQGPKIRVGTFAGPEGVELAPGDLFRLTADPAPGDRTRVGVTLPELVDELQPGQRLLLDDGLIELRVTDCEPGALVTEVLVGGPLTDHKGINVPEVDLSIPALSDKDIHDLELGADIGVDWVALSFVRRVEDLALARHHLQRVGSTALLMAKIEKPGAVRRFDEILAEADGVMIARGDLGVETPPEDVPLVQKDLVARCVRAAKPVVVATQMLESMIHRPRPTRAETSDVANAIFDGADAVMLSGETAIGSWPVEAAVMMDRVAREVEQSDPYAERFYRFHPQPDPNIPDAICHSCCRIAQILPARAVACFTWTGATARHVARHRPSARIAALTPFESVARQLTVSWGVIPLTTPDPTDLDTMVALALNRLRDSEMVDPGDTVVITAGVPFGQAGTTNLLRIERA